MRKIRLFNRWTEFQKQLGLDIRPEGIAASLIEIVPKQQAWKIVDQCFIDHRKMLFEEILNEIQQLFFGYENFTVIVGLPFHKVLIKEILLDKNLTDHEMYDYWRQQALQLMPKGNTPVRVDYEVLPVRTNTNSSLKLVRGVIVCCDELKTILFQCQKFGWEVQAVEVTILSLGRILPMLAGYSTEKDYGILIQTKFGPLFCAFSAALMYFSEKISSQEGLASVLHKYHFSYPERFLECIFILSDELSDFQNHILTFSWIGAIKSIKFLEIESEKKFIGSLSLALR